MQTKFGLSHAENLLHYYQSCIGVICLTSSALKSKVSATCSTVNPIANIVGTAFSLPLS
ncbi:hypothetical protein [Nostoc sp. C117]|uniref:hypothetical protein n=1 Tax=Nostoc sp. C117 TaxID=3349875 RepID=UPI00370D71B4